MNGAGWYSGGPHHSATGPPVPVLGRLGEMAFVLKARASRRRVSWVTLMMAFDQTCERCLGGLARWMVSEAPLAPGCAFGVGGLMCGASLAFLALQGRGVMIVSTTMQHGQERGD